MTELERPTVVRRTVAFAEAVYRGPHDGRGRGRRPRRRRGRRSAASSPRASSRSSSTRRRARVHELAARRCSSTPSWPSATSARSIGDAPAVVALGPGFVAGRDAHAVVETKRGHTLGRVITDGAALPNTGVPGEIGGVGEERLLRAPAAGVFVGTREIGERVRAGEIVGRVGDVPVRARIDGLLRGLLRSGARGDARACKLGDVDPRGVPRALRLVSDKALAIAGGVLEAACALLGLVVRPRPSQPISRGRHRPRGTVHRDRWRIETARRFVSEVVHHADQGSAAGRRAAASPSRRATASSSSPTRTTSARPRPSPAWPSRSAPTRSSPTSLTT